MTGINFRSNILFLKFIPLINSLLEQVKTVQLASTRFTGRALTGKPECEQTAFPCSTLASLVPRPHVSSHAAWAEAGGR